MEHNLTAMQEDKIRREAIEKLRSNRVGALLQIMDDLDNMRLSAKQIEAVLQECGLNYKCAMMMGTKLKGRWGSLQPQPRSTRRKF